MNASGHATVSGTLLGKPFVAQDAIAVAANGSAEGFIVITDYPNACSLALASASKANSTAITFDFYMQHFAAGTYNTVFFRNTDPNIADAQVEHSDATCSTNGASATSGTVIITQVDATAVTGTFDVSFGADHTSGSFTAGLIAQPAPSDDGTACR
jgi:hypothetical protein